MTVFLQILSPEWQPCGSNGIIQKSTLHRLKARPCSPVVLYVSVSSPRGFCYLPLSLQWRRSRGLYLWGHSRVFSDAAQTCSKLHVSRHRNVAPSAWGKPQSYKYRQWRLVYPSLRPKHKSNSNKLLTLSSNPVSIQSTSFFVNFTFFHVQSP